VVVEDLEEKANGGDDRGTVTVALISKVVGVVGLGVAHANRALSLH
jgi:hypothetical protein